MKIKNSNIYQLSIMKNAKIMFCILGLFGYTGITTAQNNTYEDRMYEDLAYKEVIKLYESKDQLTLEEMERIANGYRLNHDTENAALWFGEIIKETDNPINLLYYAQALQSNGNAQKAKEYFLKYNDLIGSESADQRGVDLAAAIDRMNEWGNDEDIMLERADAINSENLDFSPTFYKDGIVFVSSRKLTDNKKYKWTDEYFMNLYYATANENGDLDKVQSFSKMINSKYHEGPVAFNKSFDRIFFTRNDHLNGKLNKNKKGILKLGIFTALRDGEKWTEPKALDFNTTEYEECHPTITADGKLLYFASDRQGGQGGMDIYVAEFNAGKWNEPRNLGPTINTPGNDVFPFIHDDGTLYFASDGWGGFGGLDIFYTKKEGTDRWTLATNMGQPYNSLKDDFGFVLNVLGTEGYLNSSRTGGKGKDDIYSFKRRSFEESKKEISDNTHKSDITIYKLTNNYYTEMNVDREMETKLPGKDENSKPKIVENPINLMVEPKVPNVFSEITLSTVEKEKGIEVKSEKPLPTLDLMVRRNQFTIGEVFELDNLYYGFNKQKTNKQGTKELDRLIQVMQKNPNMKIELSAHTDSRGRDRYNTWLSRKRAEGAMDYMIAQGINPDRIVAIGHGENKLRNNCQDGIDCEEKYHRMNRRTEIKILTR